jgi:predicted dehydrogenase
LASERATIDIGVIGYGEWGPNHVRNFNSLPGARVVACADMRSERREAAAQLYPQMRVEGDPHRLMADPDVRAVVVATPTRTHFDLVMEALRSGKDVLCEKPLAGSVGEAREMVAEAERLGRVLMVGHVFLFNPGIQKMRDYVASGESGAIHYAYSTRTNLGPFRQDVNAVWDLAAHDVSIFNHLFGSLPDQVTGRGEAYLQPGIEDVAFITLRYPGRILAAIHVSWIDPRKVRRITVVGDHKMLHWDDLDPEPVRVYDKGVERGAHAYQSFGEFLLHAREGDVLSPRVKPGEPLRLQAQHFVSCVRDRTKPLAHAQGGLDVVRVLEAVDRSMRQAGAPVELE